MLFVGVTVLDCKRNIVEISQSCKTITHGAEATNHTPENHDFFHSHFFFQLNSLYQSSRNKRPSCHRHIRTVGMASRVFSLGVADYFCVTDMVAVQVIQMGTFDSKRGHC